MNIAGSTNRGSVHEPLWRRALSGMQSLKVYQSVVFRFEKRRFLRLFVGAHRSHRIGHCERLSVTIFVKIGRKSPDQPPAKAFGDHFGD